MRTAFCNALIEMARQDNRIWLLTGDLGFSVLEPFRQEFPERFVNAGVAEQNMTGVATGLAMSGKIVFTYSIANFPIMRCLEQIRNDVCYHNLNVRIVAVGGGFAYGRLGYSHYGLEDLAVLRVMPNMTVLAPGDSIEVRLAMEALAEHSGPVYLRLGKGCEPIVHDTTPSFQIGKPIKVRDGDNVTLMSTGAILDVVVKAADALLQHGVSTRVLSVHTLHPIEVDTILLAASETRAIITVEEHGISGLFSAVAEILVQHDYRAQLKPLFVSGALPTTASDQDALREMFGLDVRSIVTAGRAICGR